MSCVVYRHFWISRLCYRWIPDWRADDEGFQPHPGLQNLRSFIGNLTLSLRVASYNQVKMLDIALPLLTTVQWSRLSSGILPCLPLRTVILRGFQSAWNTDKKLPRVSLSQLTKLVLRPSRRVSLNMFICKVSMRFDIATHDR